MKLQVQNEMFSLGQHKNHRRHIKRSPRAGIPNPPNRRDNLLPEHPDARLSHRTRDLLTGTPSPPDLKEDPHVEKPQADPRGQKATSPTREYNFHEVILKPYQFHLGHRVLLLNGKHSHQLGLEDQGEHESSSDRSNLVPLQAAPKNHQPPSLTPTRYYRTMGCFSSKPSRSRENVDTSFVPKGRGRMRKAPRYRVEWGSSDILEPARSYRRGAPNTPAPRLRHNESRVGLPKHVQSRSHTRYPHCTRSYRSG